MGNEAELSLYAYPGAVVTERKQGHLLQGSEFEMHDNLISYTRRQRYSLV